MKYAFIFLASIAWSVNALSQIESLTIEAFDYDEPPTKEGRDTFRITFNRTKNGSLEASAISHGKKKVSINSEISQSRVTSFEQWKTSNRKDFVIKDFPVDERRAMNYLIDNRFVSKSNLSFVIKTDSFHFCQSQQQNYSISTGGYEIKIGTVPEIFKTKFESDASGKNQFDLQAYLFGIVLFNGNLPKEFSHSDFFSEQDFNHILGIYSQTIQCEDFYYKRFVKDHPERSPQQNRTKEGWDFKNYLKSLGKVE